jgi:hypothetical protein
MKELDYITKQMQEEIEQDGTLDAVEKNYINSRLLARKYKIEEDIKCFKKDACNNKCKISCCKRMDLQVLKCMTN